MAEKRKLQQVSFAKMQNFSCYLWVLNFVFLTRNCCLMLDWDVGLCSDEDYMLFHLRQWIEKQAMAGIVHKTLEMADFFPFCRSLSFISVHGLHGNFSGKLSFNPPSSPLFHYDPIN